ncbi:MAG: hypothetical protein K9M10_00015 [Candidatus Pacebacteria bacterium]|nr:hypothetical protein [Candidatus Paceibacterota bacterium]MCF7856850.1 hypothetical protein [Candidatus Paceibacterota bacterium]
MEKFQNQSENTAPQEASQPPQFLKEFSRENSQEERDVIAGAIRERRRERDAWRAEQNTRVEGKENLEAELETLQGQIDTYGGESFLRKIKDYFAYRNVKAQLAERAGSLASAQDSVDAWQSEKPDFQEVHSLLNNFYEGEEKKWAEAGHTPEDIEQQFTEEHLASLSVEDYALLMKRFPSEMLTHVTRQGIRDHADSFWHTAGVGGYSNGFKEMLADGKLRSSLGIALQEHSKEEAMAIFLKLNRIDEVLPNTRNLSMRERALLMFANSFDHNIATDDAFADSAAVHLASESVMDGMYGSERGNEIFVAYPSAYVASQLRYGGKGTLADRGMSQHNDKWVYTKDHEGMSLDVGLVFIPEDAQVDPKTGSRYKIDERGEPIVPKQRMDEVLKARFENLGFVQTFIQQLPHRMNQAPEQEREALAEASFAEFGISDPDTKKALLDPRLIDKLADIWGKDDENEEYERILNEYFHHNAESPYELAGGTMSSKEYWEKHFQENPTERPSKVVYYKGGDPSRALNEWREKNGIVKKTEDPTYGFTEHNVADSSDEANVGKDRFASLARKVIDDRFPDREVART